MIEETENLLCEAHGVVVVGVFPTKGQLGTAPDGVLRLQATWAGGRIFYLWATAGRYLPDTHTHTHTHTHAHTRVFF